MFVIKRPQAVKTDRISEMSRKFSLHYTSGFKNRMENMLVSLSSEEN